MEVYWHWLCSIDGMYRFTISNLMDYFSNPKNLFEASTKEILGLKCCKPLIKEKILKERQDKNPQAAYHERKRAGIEFISIGNPGYPKRLQSIPDPPFGLFYKGMLPKNEKTSIAIIGARRCSGYGRRTASMLARELSEHDIQIISGMASGIDGYSQCAALEVQGKSFGVLGCGVDICYPGQNRNLYERLCRDGGVLSEYPPGSRPLPFHFPLRNRIISGLSDAVVVVEAKEKSGSLITVDCAIEQGREVYAVPGNIGEQLSGGCNSLIAQGASIVTKAEDILRDFGIAGKNCSQNKNNITLETKEDLVYSCLDLSSKSLNRIIQETGLSIRELTGILLSLELKGFVKETGKNFYEKTR